MKIVIVGGGTAGWLSAMYLANKNIRKDGYTPYEIVVIESKTIPIIGAGEGSTGALAATIKQKLKNLKGLNQTEFFKRANATIKLGLNCKDWNGDGKSFLEPLQSSNTSNFSYLDVDYLLASAHGESYLSSPIGTAWDMNKVPLQSGSLDDFGAYGYHFDAHKVGEYFKEVALQNGVKHIEADVVETDVDGTGNLIAVTLDNGNTILSDMWFDCTGFNKTLINSVGGKWKSYSDYLPCNKAMPYLYDYEENETIRPETLAWAMPNGWMWQIPTQERYGCGYVYSDKFITDEEALEELQLITGRKINPIKIIEFNAGRQENVWIKNVIAFGLASNFLEPLEATSIHSTIVQLELFTSLYLGIDSNETIFESNVNKYNTNFAEMMDGYMDLIQIHYITKREDSEFWKWVKNEMPKTNKVKEVIEMCRYKCPSPLDWNGSAGFAGWGVWSSILTGLEILDKQTICNTLWNTDMNTESNTMYQSMIHHYFKKSKNFITHNEFINIFKNK
jgi:hypothetical protein